MFGGLWWIILGRCKGKGPDVRRPNKPTVTRRSRRTTMMMVMMMLAQPVFSRLEGVAVVAAAAMAPMIVV